MMEDFVVLLGAAVAQPNMWLGRLLPQSGGTVVQTDQRKFTRQSCE